MTSTSLKVCIKSKSGQYLCLSSTAAAAITSLRPIPGSVTSTNIKTDPRIILCLDRWENGTCSIRPFNRPCTTSRFYLRVAYYEPRDSRYEDEPKVDCQEERLDGVTLGSRYLRLKSLPGGSTLIQVGDEMREEGVGTKRCYLGVKESGMVYCEFVKAKDGDEDLILPDAIHFEVILLGEDFGA